MSDQFGMGTGFHDAALVHHHQAIHASDGGKAVRNGDHRLATHQELQAVLDGSFGREVANRKALELLMSYSVQQQLVSKPIPIDALY